MIPTRWGRIRIEARWFEHRICRVDSLTIYWEICFNTRVYEHLAGNLVEDGLRRGLNPPWTLVFRLNIPKELCQLFFCQLNLFLLCSLFFATTLSHECETSEATYHHKPRTRHSANILQSCSPAQRSLQWIRGRLTFNYQAKKKRVAFTYFRGNAGNPYARQAGA